MYLSVSAFSVPAIDFPTSPSVYSQLALVSVPFKISPSLPINQKSQNSKHHDFQGFGAGP
jgi:hypothetical protein